MNPFIAKAIGAAFIAWVNNAREKMAAKSRSEVMDEAELTALLAEVFKKTRATYITDLGPAVVSAFIAGNIESGFGVNRKSVEVLAYNYAASIVDYANQMTSLSAAEAYRGIINRKKSPKEAFNFMVNSLGVDRRAVRSLLAMFDSKDEVENKSLSSMRPNKKKQRMDNYVAAAIELRAKRMGEEESFGAKETSKALVWNLAKVQGVVDGQRKRWVTARDELVCPSCGPMDGQTVELDEKFVLPNKTEVWAPSLHPNCFPSWVPVGSATGIIGADSRWYEGKLVIINTASGREVSVTPNHPVLTDKGWVAAGDLVVGDNLVSYRGDVERKLTSRPDDEGIESPISQVFEAIRESSCVSATRVPVTPEQFHGDGVVDTEVDVVFSDRLLGNDGHPTTLKLPSESKILLGSVTEVSFFDASSESQLLIGNGTPSNSSVSSASKLSPVGSAEVSHSVVHSLRSISGGNTSANEPFSDYLPGDVVSSGEFLDALTGLVEFDQVVDIRTIDWSGHVYNLQTGGGWYTANSIVVHNCRCKAVIVVRVKGDRKKKSLFDRARDLIGKSDNDWETQPRSSDGRFGNRPRGMSFRDHAAPTQAPQPQRMTTTKLKERPRGITYQDIDWSAVEQQLKTAPEVKVKTKPKDQDVAQALPKPKPVSEMTLEEYVRHIQTKPDEPVSIAKGITVISRIQGIKPVAVIDLKTIEKIAYVEVTPKINPVDLATASTATKVVTDPVKVVDLKTTVANAAQAVGVVTDVDTDVKLDEDNKIYAFGYIGDGEMTVNGSTLASSSPTDVSRSVRDFMENEIMKFVEDIPSDHTYTIRTSDGDRVKVTGADIRDAAISYANSVADQKINEQFNEVDLDNGVSTYHTDDEILDAWERASKLPASINDFARHFDFKSAINPNDYGFINLSPMVGSDERFAVTHGEHTDGIHIVTDREFGITIDLNSGNAIPDDPEVDTDFDEFVSDTNPFDGSTWE